MEIKNIISIPTETIEIYEIEKYRKYINFSQRKNEKTNTQNCSELKNVFNKNINEKNISTKIDFKTLTNIEVKKDEIYNYENMLKSTILDNLAYDRRIKKIEEKNENLLVKFWSIGEAISFYKHYFQYLSMKFSRYHKYERNINENSNIIHKNDFKFSLLRCAVDELKPQIENTTSIFFSPESQCEDNFTDFNEKILYFCNLSKHFSVNELKNVEQTIQENNYELLFEKTREIAVGIATNVIFQKTISSMNQENLEKIVDRLNYDLAPMSSTKYGAYSIQILIHSVQTITAIEKIKKYFNPFIIDLFKHPIGNYTMQKILKLENDYIFGHLSTGFVEIMSDELGYKVFKNCLESFTGKFEDIRILLQQNTVYFDKKKNDEIIAKLVKK